MKITYNTVRLFVLLGLGLWIGIIMIDTINGIIEWEHTSSTRTAIIQTIPVEYSHLFNLQSREKIRNSFTDLSSVRFPISHFDYDDNKYCIIETKIKLDSDISLSKIINEIHTKTSISKGNTYWGITESNFNFYYLAKPIHTSNVLLALDGDSIRTLSKNDSTISYYFKMRSFSMQYDQNYLKDLVANAKGDKIPVCLSFIKRNRLLYIILMSINYDNKLQPDLLSNAITPSY